MNIVFLDTSRPKFRPYLWALIGLAAALIGYMFFRSYQYWELTGIFEAPYMDGVFRKGLLAVVAMVAIAYAGHWMLKASSGAEAASASTTAPQSPAMMSSGDPAAAQVLAGTGAKYALEIRAVGLAISGRHQDTVWKQIEAKADNYGTILSDDPKRYGENPDERKIFSQVATTAAFEYVASQAVDHWPIPVIILGPPRGPNVKYRAAYEIADGRQHAGLGVTEFLLQDDQNTTSAAPALGELFEFFDKHPDVPAALILSQDGMQYRWAAKTPGTPSDPRGPFIPPVPDSMGGLLVSRTDRVDRLIRPYAVNVPGDVDMTKTQYDVVKLWNFYWDKDTQFQDETDKAAGGLSGAWTMKSDWWISHLPEFWQNASNKGPGDFRASPYLPARWTTWQVEEFDEAPLLGYLHRPVQVKLTDKEGKPLKQAEQGTALQAGWKQAVATLPDGAKLSRVFYDTTASRDWVIPISQALRGNSEGVDIGAVKEGYDIGRRIGNTGVSSTLVQICLATIAGYQEGGASATVNLIDQDTASIVMVSPPDAARKALNEKNRGSNPFQYRSQ